MSDEGVIPTSYDQWRNCIENRCKIPLTPAYISERLTELQNGGNPNTQSFEKLYGTEYLQQTISWFRRASEEANAG